MSERRAVYGGSFDPPTLGHENILAQAVEVFDKVFVVVANNPLKQHRFKSIDRASCWLNIIKEAGYGDRVELHEFPAGANLHRCAYERYGVQWAVRGIRGPRDLEDERDMRAANRILTPGVQPVYFLAPPALEHISSSMVRSLMGLDGWGKDIKKFVSPVVAHFLMVRCQNARA